MAEKRGRDNGAPVAQASEPPRFANPRAELLRRSGDGELVAVELRRLWVAVSSRHSDLMADRPWRWKRSAPRLDECKNGGRQSAGNQSKAVLVRALSERHPDLVAHNADVSRMAELVARQLSVPEDQLPSMHHAAELHDIGKVGIPDAILSKPGPLDADEWEFIAGTRSSANVSSPGHLRSLRSAAWCARATSAGTALDTPTGSPAKRSAGLPDHRRMRRL